MKSIKTIFMVIMLSLCWVHGSQAATYYMRADGTAPNKEAATGPPSDKSKCMNVATHNKEAFFSGDVILISSRGGEYTTSIVVPSSGVTNYIHYKNVAEETPVFHRDTEWTGGWTDLGDGRYTANIPVGLAKLWEDGIPLQRAKNNTLVDGNFYHIHGEPIYYKPTSGVPANHTITYLSDYSIQAGIHIEDKSKIYVGSLSPGRLKFGRCRGVFTNSATVAVSDIVIDNCYFEYSYDCYLNLGIAGEGTNKVEIKNNEFYCCRSAIRPYVKCSYFSIHDNYGYGVGTIDGSKCWNWIGGGDKEFIGIATPRNCIIYNNISVDGHNIFIHQYTKSDGSPSYNNVYYNNYCYNNKAQFICIQGDPGLEWTTYSNMFYNNIGINVATGGEAGSAEDRAILIRESTVPAKSQNYFYNNTVIGGARGIHFWGVDDEKNNYYYTFKNNIFRNQSGTSVHLNWATLDNTVFAHNCYGKDVFYDGTAYKTLSDWKIEFPNQEQNSILSSPLFVNEGGSTPKDYRLYTGSSCIGAGTNVGLTTDYLGNKWRNPPSIGAIEYYKTGGVISPRTVGGSNYKQK